MSDLSHPQAAAHVPIWPAVAAFALPILLLAPFAGKAYNIDEPVFIWVAQQIREHPLDFFGFIVDEGYKKTPMFHYNHNPPGVSYYLAAVSLLFGWGEVPMHLATDLAAGLTGLGVYMLARRLCARPLLAAMLVILSPAFLISATSVMTDVSMVMFYVWGVYAWLRGLDTGRRAWLLAGALAVSASAVCKYFGITAVPLLFAYTLLRARSFDGRIGYLLIPLSMLAALQAWTWRLYGSANIFDAAGVALQDQFRIEEGAFFRPLAVLIFAGGAYAPLVLFLPRVFKWPWLVVVAILCALFAWPLIEGYSAMQLMMGKPTPFPPRVLAHAATMLFAGGLIAAVPFKVLYMQRGAETALLTLWFAGTVVFAAFINHFVDVRVLLTALPPAVLLLMRALPAPAAEKGHLRDWWPMPIAAVFSLWLAAADYSIAGNARTSVQRALTRMQAEQVPMYFYGMWGFHHYFQELGVPPLDVVRNEKGLGALKLRKGELLAASSEIHERLRTAPPGFELVEVYTFPNRWHAATFHPVEEAGFYSHLSGILPYQIGRLQPEEYGLYRWVGPSYIPDATEGIAQ